MDTSNTFCPVDFLKTFEVLTENHASSNNNTEASDKKKIKNLNKQLQRLQNTSNEIFQLYKKERHRAEVLNKECVEFKQQYSELQSEYKELDTKYITETHYLKELLNEQKINNEVSSTDHIDLARDYLQVLSVLTQHNNYQLDINQKKIMLKTEDFLNISYPEYKSIKIVKNQRKRKCNTDSSTDIGIKSFTTESPKSKNTKKIKNIDDEPRTWTWDILESNDCLPPTPQSLTDSGSLALDFDSHSICSFKSAHDSRSSKRPIMIDRFIQTHFEIDSMLVSTGTNTDIELEKLPPLPSLPIFDDESENMISQGYIKNVEKEKLPSLPSLPMFDVDCKNIMVSENITVIEEEKSLPLSTLPMFEFEIEILPNIPQDDQVNIEEPSNDYESNDDKNLRDQSVVVNDKKSNEIKKLDQVFKSIGINTDLPDKILTNTSDASMNTEDPYRPKMVSQSTSTLNSTRNQGTLTDTKSYISIGLQYPEYISETQESIESVLSEMIYEMPKLIEPISEMVHILPKSISITDSGCQTEQSKEIEHEIFEKKSISTCGTQSSTLLEVVRPIFNKSLEKFCSACESKIKQLLEPLQEMSKTNMEKFYKFNRTESIHSLELQSAISEYHVEEINISGEAKATEMHVVFENEICMKPNVSCETLTRENHQSTEETIECSLGENIKLSTMLPEESSSTESNEKLYKFTIPDTIHLNIIEETNDSSKLNSSLEKHIEKKVNNKKNNDINVSTNEETKDDLRRDDEFSTKQTDSDVNNPDSIKGNIELINNDKLFKIPPLPMKKRKRKKESFTKILKKIQYFINWQPLMDIVTPIEEINSLRLLFPYENESIDYESPLSPNNIEEEFDFEFEAINIPITRDDENVNEYLDNEVQEIMKQPPVKTKHPESPESPPPFVQLNGSVPYEPIEIPITERSAINIIIKNKSIRNLLTFNKSCKQKMKSNVIDKSYVIRLCRIRKCIMEYLDSEWTDENHTKSIKILRKYAKGENILVDALWETVEDLEKNEIISDECTPPAPAMPLYHQKLILLVKSLTDINSKLPILIDKKMEKNIFKLKSEYNIEQLTSITYFYISIVDLFFNGNRKKLSYFVYKSLYFYGYNAISIIFILIKAYPMILPKKRELLKRIHPEIDWNNMSARDASKLNIDYRELNSIDLVVMYMLTKTTNYQNNKQDSINLKNHPLYDYLPKYYGFSLNFMSLTLLLKILIERLENNELENLSFSIILIVRRIKPIYSLQMLKNLLTLLKKYFNEDQKNIETIHDNQIVVIIESVSTCLKCFNSEVKLFKDISPLLITMFNSHKSFVVQETCLMSLLRLHGFLKNHIDLYNMIQNWNPSQTINSNLQMMIRTFIHRKNVNTFNCLEIHEKCELD